MTNDNVETTKVGKKGIVVIPAPMRQRFGLSEGSGSPRITVFATRYSVRRRQISHSH
jgi:bifunctional DNA-binding transcriptional regulator/antitoxin component of YhaV-PrlF toxin-antitoxin module